MIWQVSQFPNRVVHRYAYISHCNPVRDMRTRGMGTPTIRQVVEELGISRGYACDILNNKTQPRGLIVQIYRRFGWKAPLIADMSDEQIDMIEEVERLAPTGRKAAA
jgi:hypothetical protein